MNDAVSDNAQARILVLPAPVQAVVNAYLQSVDAAVPGLVHGLYLVGSVALGDFRPHRSDIDFVALMARRPDRAVLRALERVHARMHRRPYFDGIYVLRSDLAVDPAGLDRCSTVHEGRFHPAGIGDIIAWHTLARYGVRCRRDARGDLRIRTEAVALAAWTEHNLDSYWQRRVLDGGTRLLTRNGLTGLSAWACEWCVTGVSRLHYTLATGDITSTAVIAHELLSDDELEDLRRIAAAEAERNA